MRILLVSTLRDEGPHVLEWIAHHKAMGVTDFLLFTNDCADGTDLMLEALAGQGVTHLPNRPEAGKSLQWNALRLAWGHNLRKVADWILCIDCDEFINLRAPLSTLQSLIEHCAPADAIVLPWRLFGHNGHARLTEALTCQAFTRAAPEGCNYPVGGRQFKTLFRARGPFRQIGVHRPRLKKDATAHWVDGSGASMPEAFAQQDKRITLFGLPAAMDLVQLNHYSVRSAQSFMLKQRRGLPNRRRKAIDMNYWVERNFNTAEDTSIEGLMPATKAELARLLQVDGVAELHAKAVAHHHAEFQALMADEEAVKFFGRLLLAHSSTPLPEPVIADLVSLYQAAHGA